MQLKLVINTLEEPVDKFMALVNNFMALANKLKVLARTIKRKVMSAVFRLKLLEAIESIMVQDSNSTPLPRLLF